MKKVLLIEDDGKVAHAIGIALKAMGYDVVTASDAVTATAQARKCQADVIVLDINLPGGDGFVVAERLGNLVGTAALPIIFITASKQQGLRERAKQLGAVRFLEKPFGVTELADAIEAAYMRYDITKGEVQIG